VIPPEDPTPGQRARNLLNAATTQPATNPARAAAWATLELADAIDRQTAVLARLVPPPEPVQRLVPEEDNR
jgi:hypothetical protein